MKNELNTIIKTLDKLDLEIKFKYHNDEELFKILLKIAKEKKKDFNAVNTFSLNFEIDKNSIQILKNDKIVRVFDSYITDLSSYNDYLYQNYVEIIEKNEVKRYSLGYISEKFNGFLCADNKKKANKIIKKYLEKYYNEFV